MLGELVDDPLDILFGNVAAIEPVNLVEDLSVAQPGHLFEVYVQATSDGLDNEFCIDGSLEDFEENVTSLSAHLVGLLSLFDVISAPNIEGQERVGKLPEAKLAVLVRIIPSKEVLNVDHHDFQIHSFKRELKFVHGYSVLWRSRKIIECRHEREISSVRQFSPNNFKVGLQIQNFLEAISHQDDHGLIHDGFLERLFWQLLWDLLGTWELLCRKLIGRLVRTHQPCRWIVALEVFITLSFLFFQNALSSGLCRTQWARALLESSVVAFDAG